MPTPGQRLVAALLRRYPLYSGRGVLANQAPVRWLADRGETEAWSPVHGGQLLCPLADYVGRAAYFTGDFDRKITWLCRRLVAPGDTVIDVGANFGLITLLLARLVGETGTVHSVEPNPAMLALLEQTMRRNRLENVVLHTYALGDRQARAVLAVPAGNAGAASLCAHRTRPEARRIPVEVRTLSDLAAASDIRAVALIKIDVEGFEPQVLRGGRDFIAEARPRAILFEMNERVPPAEHPTFALLRELDYGVFSIPHCLLRMRVRRFDPLADGTTTSHDFLAVPRGAPYEAAAARLGA